MRRDPVFKNCKFSCLLYIIRKKDCLSDGVPQNAEKPKAEFHSAEFIWQNFHFRRIPFGRKISH
jgi:hypothetical protein